MRWLVVGADNPTVTKNGAIRSPRFFSLKKDRSLQRLLLELLQAAIFCF